MNHKSMCPLKERCMTAKFIQENKVKLSLLKGIIFPYTLHKLTFFIVSVKIKSDSAEFDNGHAIAEYSEYSNNQQQLLSNLNFIKYN